VRYNARGQVVRQCAFLAASLHFVGCHHLDHAVRPFLVGLLKADGTARGYGVRRDPLALLLLARRAR